MTRRTRLLDMHVHACTKTLLQVRKPLLPGFAFVGYNIPLFMANRYVGHQLSTSEMKREKFARMNRKQSLPCKKWPY